MRIELLDRLDACLRRGDEIVEICECLVELPYSVFKEDVCGGEYVRGRQKIPWRTLIEETWKPGTETFSLDI